MPQTVLQHLLTPVWAAQLLSGAKSFVDNPLIGSPWLNARGLHAGRVKLAHGMADKRRARLADKVDPADKATFDRDGVVEIRDFLPPDLFSALRAEIHDFRGPARETVQGDTITRRFAIDPPAIRAIPAIRTFTGDPRWRGLSRYVASFDIEPLLYIQSILSHRHEAPPDPQLALHSDTFHPAMKAWLFLEDVTPDIGAFTYVRGSHRLTPERLAWEKRRSLTARDGSCRLSARGSLRIEAHELAELALPQPTMFAVPANTLVIADTFGFHARGPSSFASTRIELWAYERPNPFRPFTGLDLGSLPGIAERRIPLRWWARDKMSSLAPHAWVAKGLKHVTDD